MTLAKKLQRLAASFALSLLFSSAGLLGQDEGPNVRRTTAILTGSHAQDPKPTRAEERRARQECRRDVTLWLRARQSILVPCERCGGDGILRRVVAGASAPRVKSSDGEKSTDTRSRYVTGLSTLDQRHAGCNGLGKILRPAALAQLQESYLVDASEFPGLPLTVPTETEVRRMGNDTKEEPTVRARTLMDRLGFIEKGTAQVQHIDLEAGPAGVLFATVKTSVDPKLTRWVRIKNRWKAIGKKDEEALRTALQEQNVQGGD